MYRQQITSLLAVFIMRKAIFLLVAALSGLFLFSSCQTPEPEPQEVNPLVGTKWYASYSDYLMVLEFPSDTEVIGYFAKENGVFYGGRTNGTYSVSGNRVTFAGLTYQWIYAYYKLESGTISGSLLSTTGQRTFNIEKGEWSPWSDTFSKQ